MLLEGRRIELWVEARGGAAAVNPIMQALLAELAAGGAAVSVRVPEQELIDPWQHLKGRRPDLVLLKTATTLGVSLAVADEAGGVSFLNGARVTLRAHDKAAAIARLAAAGLPVPATFLCNPPAGLTALPRLSGAWVTKPTRGVHGRGVVVHEGFPAALAEPEPLDPGRSYVVDDGTRLVQQRVGGDDADVKVYVAGDVCFAGRKPFSLESYAEDRIEPFPLDPGLAKLVLEAGGALGLRCFGVDLRFEDGRPAIVDVNPFPGYRGFPAAVRALRSEIERALVSPR